MKCRCRYILKNTTMEKYEISKLNSNSALKKRKELYITCKHFSNYYFLKFRNFMQFSVY